MPGTLQFVVALAVPVAVAVAQTPTEIPLWSLPGEGLGDQP
jgi:hypothetical protein